MTQLLEQERPSAEALSAAADRVREWFARRLDDHALDIARLYRSSRDRFVARIRAVYEAYLGEQPSLLRARVTGASAALDREVHSAVDALARELGDRAVDHVQTTLNLQPEVAQRELSRATGLSFRDLPVTAQGVLNELTTTVVGGGTFMDRVFHQSEQFRAGLFGTLRQGLLNRDDFWALRDKVHRAFGVDKLAEPRGPAYDSVKIYRNEALRQWNLTMGEQAQAAEAVEVWMAKLDATTTPGCAARHGRRLEDVGDQRPPRHYNCRCQILPLAPDTDLAAFRTEADAWLQAHGYTRRQAAQMESVRGGGDNGEPLSNPRAAVSVRDVRSDSIQLREEVGAEELFTITRRGALPSGWILAAPHANDTGTQDLVRSTGARLGITTVQPVPEAFPETGPQRLNINRPTRGEKVDPETTDPEAQATWQLYRKTILQAAGGALRLYVELHSNEAPETAFVVEVATVGLTAPQALAIKAALHECFDPPYEVRVEPVDRLRWSGYIAKTIGAFSLVERGLQFEFPQGLIAQLNAHAQLAERWFAGLREALAATGARTEEAGWAWGAERLVPLYLARGLPVYPGKYTSVPWREVPRVREGVLLAWRTTCAAAVAAGAPDHVLLRRAGRGLEVLTEAGWRSLRPSESRPADWIEVSAGYALDSPEAPAWETQAVRLPWKMIQRWPAMRVVTFPALRPGEQYAARVAPPEEAEAFTVGNALGTGLWSLGRRFEAVVQDTLAGRQMPANPVLVVAVLPASSSPFWDLPREALRTAVSLETGQVLYARDPFPPGLAAPYRRVAVVVFEPEAEVVGPVGVAPAGPTGVWAIRPRGKPFWSLPGGHLNPGETPAEAAAREIQEEAGVSVCITRSLGELYRPWATTEVFLAHRVGPAQAPAATEEIDAAAVVRVAHLELAERAFLVRHLPQHFPAEVAAQ